MNEMEPLQRPDGLLSWSLCVATMNRPRELRQSVELAMTQSVPPAEIVVVDASDDWSVSAREIAALGADNKIDVVHVGAERRSVAAQRNQAVALAKGDIVVLFDDDTYMYPDCIAELLAIYGSDEAATIAAIGAASSTVHPAQLAEDLDKVEMSFGTRNAGALNRLRRNSRFFRFLADEILMLKQENRFIAYDEDGRRFGPATASDRYFPTTFIPGFALSVRRVVAEREPFDPDLIGYSPNEDYDAVYRFARHGFVVNSRNAKVYHQQSSVSRLKRLQSHRLSLANLAFFARKHAGRGPGTFAKVHLHLARRLLADILADLVSRRLTFPSVRGAVGAIPVAVGLFFRPDASVSDWYRNQQARLLGAAVDDFDLRGRGPAPTNTVPTLTR